MKYIRFIVAIFILSAVAFSIAKEPILALSTFQAISLKSSGAFTTYLPIVHSFNESEPIAVVPDDDTKSDVRLLDIASENLEVLVVDGGEGIFRYGPTRKYFHFTDQNIVMAVAFSNLNTDFELTTSSIYIFEADETEIDKWINNHNGDGYDYYAPIPLDKIDLKSQDFKITSTEFMTHEVGNYRDEYDSYSVQYTIPHIVEDTLFELKEAVDEVPIHIRTEGTSLMLDINSGPVETLVVNTSNDRYHYGPTQKFFHFTEQNVVMRLYFSNHNPDFEPALSIYFFRVHETKIDRWINKQFDAGIFSFASPVRTIHIDPLDIEIQTTQLMTHEVGTNGDEYDTYSIEYMVRDMAEENLFSLKGFKDEIPVHIRTTDIYRVLDITSANVQTSIVDTDLDIYHYGATEKYYHFTDQYVVLKALFPNQSADIEPTFSLYIFDMDETGIDGLTGNQYPGSDYFWLTYSGPEPIHTIDIDQSNYAITLTTPISHEVGTYGDEYDTHNIEYILDDVVEDGVFEMNGFSDEVPVHVRTKDVDGDHLHLLDITSDDVKIVLQTNGFFGAHVSTKKFFHFTDQNVLLGVFFPNYNTDFEPTISIIIFDDQVTTPSIHDDKEAEIRQWIGDQQPFDMLPRIQPIHIIDISPEYYEITSTQFVEHVVGPQCGRYDKYNINYTIHDVTDESLFELSGFQDEIPLYVMIKPHDEPLMPTQEPGSPGRVCQNP